MKYKTIYIYLILGFISTLLFSCASKINLTHKTSLKNPELQLLWVTDTILSDIESVIYDKKNDIIYTSSINGNWLKKGGIGFISKLDLSGNITTHKWINNLEGPTGLTIFNDKLYVADFENVVEIDIDKSKITNTTFVEGTKRINDLTVTNDGAIYGTGTLQGKLFSIENKKVSILKNDLARPNGILVQGDNLLLGLSGLKSVNTYNLKTKSMETLTKGIINPDGITAIGNGDYLVSSWQGTIHYVYKNGDKKLLLDTSKKGINAADIHYIPSKNILLVPAMLKHKLMAYKLIDNN